MYKIIKRTPYWFIFSGTLMILSVIAISVFGLRLSIDYKGGTILEFKSSDANRQSIAEEIVKSKSYSSYQIQEASDNQIVLRLPEITNDQHIELAKDLKSKLPDYTETSYNSVGPTISKDLTWKSLEAILLASFGIIFYIAYAFRKIPKPLSSWKFGLSAVIAIIHDLLITTGVIALVGHYVSWIEVDALFMTAMLTIMGFSVHDTIVVYDRLRENFIKNPHQDINVIAEESVNQTLARSINTSVTVVIVLLSMFLLGGTSIRHFILTLIVGVIFGTYSSIFVATAIVVKWHGKIASR